jgi:general secretion pathway protein J
MCRLQQTKKNKRGILKKTAGFTLLEVLLALMIFSSLSMAANQVFSNVLRSDEQMKDVGVSLKSLQKTIIVLDSDFRQILARQYRNGGDNADEKLIEIEENLLDSEAQGIRFVRGGWINPQQLFPRSEIVKVGYRIRDEKLERIRWLYPDDSPSMEPAEMTVMEGIEDIQFEVLKGTSWSKEWDSALEMPKGLRVTLETKQYGTLTRVYLLPGQKLTSGGGQTSANGQQGTDGTAK